MKQSLGLIEVSGLALAISVSDVMAKVASIQLLDIEKTNGSGWMVVKIAGDVASVDAAIATGADFARQRNGLVASKVIARPINDLDKIVIEKRSPAKVVVAKAKTASQSAKSAPKAASTTAKGTVAKKATVAKSGAQNVKPAPIKPAVKPKVAPVKAADKKATSAAVKATRSTVKTSNTVKTNNVVKTSNTVKESPVAKSATETEIKPAVIAPVKLVSVMGE